jgi:hypothetical protein
VEIVLHHKIRLWMLYEEVCKEIVVAPVLILQVDTISMCL